MRFFRKLNILLFVVLFLITPLNNLAKAETEFDTKAISEKLKNLLVPLKTVEAGNGFEDLQPLKEILKNVKILGMGEATHGTKEFFQMKHRMYEFLVEEMGYRAFAIEAEFGSYQIINDYILNDKGTMEDVMYALVFGIWNTQEVADMINWMKEYNQNPSHKEKIRFYGFDMQGVSNSVYNVWDYLEKVDETSELLSDITHLYAPYENRLYAEPLLEQLENTFQKNKDKFVSRSSPDEYEMNLRDLSIVKQNLQYGQFFSENTGNSNESLINLFNYRDLSMADNVKWIYEYEKKYFNNDKIMLWAHNGHISNDSRLVTNMGKLLKDTFKNEYYSLGFDFYKGSLITTGVDSFTGFQAHGILELNEPKETIFSTYFKEVGFPISFLDFKTASADFELNNWLSEEHSMYSIGWALYETRELTKVIPIEYYDGIINIQNTNAAVSFWHDDLPKVQPIPLSTRDDTDTATTVSTEHEDSPTEFEAAVPGISDSEVTSAASYEDASQDNATTNFSGILGFVVILSIVSLWLWRTNLN